MNVDKTEESAVLGKGSSITGDFNLLEDLFIEILLRIPVKSLIKFSCVSKSWNELVKSPAFVTKHLNFSAQSKNQHLIAHIQCATKQFIALIPQNSQSPDDYRVHSIPSFEFEIVGSCNGLVCVGCFSGYINVYLWNPATRDFVELREIRFSKNLPHNVVIGFGINPNTSDYEVVYFSDNGDKKVRSVEVEIYSKSSGTWSKIKAILECNIRRSSSTVTTNGVIHWMGQKTINSNLCQVIVCFDLKNRMFKDMELPKPCDHSNSSWKLTVVEDSLGVILTDSSSIDVWVMKDYSVKASWSKRASVRSVIDDMSIPINEKIGINWLKFHSKKGEIIMGEKIEGQVHSSGMTTKHNYELSSYDPECGESKKLLLLRDQCVTNVQVYIESFLPLPKGRKNSWFTSRAEYLNSN